MRRIAFIGVAWVLGCGMCLAQINMPDPSLIHGKALPAPELPSGTVTVRVVRETIGNNVRGESVRITIGGVVRTSTTDEQGRAEFTRLPIAAETRAEAVVGGERLVSDPFTVPSSGGLRVILVAGLKEAAARKERESAAAAAAPPVRGAVVFSPNSRILMEFRDDALQVFYVLDILNSARTRVDIGGPLIINLPRGAGGASMLPGSSPSATVSGDRVTVTGPFASGNTSVQVGFQLRQDSSDLTLQQTWPARLEQLTVAVEKIGNVSMASSQFSTVGEVRAETGTLFLLASGPGLPANSTLTVQLSNLPVHGRTSRYVALALAALIIGVGAWLAFGSRSRARDFRGPLIARRDALLSELADLEGAIRRNPRPDSGEDPQYANRRQRLLWEIERIYGELDESAVGPQGGGEDVAA